MENPVLVGVPFHVLDEVDSTNNYAMDRIADGTAKEGMAWLARHQSNGRGQRGNSWHAATGDNINLSIVLQPVMLKPVDQFVLSALIALSVFDVMKEWTGVETRIKWSNDIYWRDKKAGGILIENIIRGNSWSYTIAGIGLNINQLSFPDKLPNPVSLRQITGKQFDIEKLARIICKSIENRYNQLTPLCFQSIIEEYESRLFRLRQPSLFSQGEAVFEGIIHGVEPDGRLILQRGTQMLRLGFGSVRFVI